MKALLLVLVILAGLVAIASMIGLVGFHYPAVITDEPLQHPVKVTRVEGRRLLLENGRVIVVSPDVATQLSATIRGAGFEIDVVNLNDVDVDIWARQPGWICGTPWAQPIRIPIIRDTVYRNQRQLIARGHYDVPPATPPVPERQD